MVNFEVGGHEPSLLPDCEWKMVWHDEFDGLELDRSKWDFRLSMMGRRHPAWVERGVRLDGRSHVVFDLVEEDGRPVSAKFVHRYGYYECRCRLQQNTDAWWSAFWLQSTVIGASLDAGDTGAEIDVMEYTRSGRIASHNVFTGGYGLDSRRLKTGGVDGIDTAAFHRFGLLWEPTGYTFYVDGVENGRITEEVSHRPEFILITTEVKGYRHDDHRPVAAAFDAIGRDSFVVDHVRVFDAVH